MRRNGIARAGTLGVALALTLGTGVAVAKPSDGYRDQQDYANVALSKALDGCLSADVWAAFVAGDLLKNPIGGGAPGPWSDITVVVHLRDACAETTTELSGFIIAPPEIVRLEAATVDGIVVPITDVSGELEADVEVTLDWAVAGAARSVHYNDPANGYFREERNAPASVVGTIDFSDPDGDVLAKGFGLTDADALDANIGFANEIALIR